MSTRQVEGHKTKSSFLHPNGKQVHGQENRSDPEHNLEPDHRSHMSTVVQIESVCRIRLVLILHVRAIHIGAIRLIHQVTV